MAEWIAEGTPDGRMPERIAPLHKHNNDDEAWYVLEGTLGFQIGDKILEANASQAVVVPRGTPHTYWNPKPEQAKYLIIMTAKIHSLIEGIHHATQRDQETMKELFRKYDSELL
ncbi:cupin domain-containing protein [Cohnella sp. CFH 77786]|nr:cupin domain-containing protein [Cohnella sp. CFH 77786]